MRVLFGPLYAVLFGLLYCGSSDPFFSAPSLFDSRTAEEKDTKEQKKECSRYLFAKITQ